MNIKNRIIVIIFFVILAPIIAIAAFVLNSAIDPQSQLLSSDFKENLNWFSSNSDLSKNIVLGLYIVAGVFLAVALYNILAAAWDKSSDEDLR